MAKLTKLKKNWKEKLGEQTPVETERAFELVKEYATRKFEESVDAVVNLGIDPRKSDQVIRGSCPLPHGTGKVERVLVFAKNEKMKEAEEAGADYVGGTDWVMKIQDGWLEFDRVIATPDMMAEVGRIGKILGPRGLMPNPKVGTVTFDVANAIKEIKKGQVQFRTDKGGNVHVPIGKSGFDPTKLLENLQAVIDRIVKLKPTTAKGVYVKKVVVSSTMGPGIPVNVTSLKT